LSTRRSRRPVIIMADPDFSVITLSDVQSLLSQLDLPTDASLEDAFNFQPNAAGASAPVPPFAAPQPQAYASPVVSAVPARADTTVLPHIAVAAAPIDPPGPPGQHPPVNMMHAPMQVPQVGVGSSRAPSRDRPPARAGASDSGASPRGDARAAYREKVFGSLRVLLDLCVHGEAWKSNPK
jgi:hypothetical protein